jgi:hypothetical protein
MRIRLNEPDLADDLVAFLARCECTVERVGRDVLSVDYAGLARPETALNLVRNGLCYSCGDEVGSTLARLGSPLCADCRHGSWPDRPSGRNRDRLVVGSYLRVWSKLHPGALVSVVA